MRIKQYSYKKIKDLTYFYICIKSNIFNYFSPIQLRCNWKIIYKHQNIFKIIYPNRNISQTKMFDSIHYIVKIKNQNISMIFTC